MISLQRHGKAWLKNKGLKFESYARYLILSCVFLLSFPNIVKGISHCLLHSKQGDGFTPVYPSLRTKSIPSSCTYDFDQDPLVEPHKNNDHPYKNHGATVDIVSFFESLGRHLQPLLEQE